MDDLPYFPLLKQISFPCETDIRGQNSSVSRIIGKNIAVEFAAVKY
jgi:hypothetical protein